MYKYSFATLYTTLQRAGPWSMPRGRSKPWQVSAAPSAHRKTQMDLMFTSISSKYLHLPEQSGSMIELPSRLWALVLSERKDATSLWSNYNIRDRNTTWWGRVLSTAIINRESQRLLYPSSVSDVRETSNVCDGNTREVQCRWVFASALTTEA